MGNIKTRNRISDIGRNRGSNKLVPEKSKLTDILFKPVRLLAVFALAFILTACGGAKTDTSSSSSNTNTGNPSVAVSASPYTGNVCPNGGITVETGIDENSNGILDTGEVDETQIVCNGTNGTNGTDGTSIAISLNIEPVGSNCANGGIKIEAGHDDNGNGVLDIPGEVDDTDYVCNGADGSGYANLQGTITLSGQSDHSGITVSLAGTGYSTTTDAAGGYTLTNIPSGAYNIVFDAPAGSGYETGATLYGYRLFAGIDDYDLLDTDMQLGRGILLSEINRESSSYAVQVSPDSSRVVYTDSSDNLYSVPIGGGTPALLASGVYDYSVKISPDSAYVIFTDNDYYSRNLYSVPISGGTPALLASGVSISVQISPDSVYVIFTVGDEYAYTGNLYTVQVNGGTPTLLASDVSSYSVKISPDSAYVIFTDNDYYSSNLYSVPTGGGTPTLMASDIHYSAQISPDSTSVVYVRQFGTETNYYEGYSLRLLAAQLL